MKSKNTLPNNIRLWADFHAAMLHRMYPVNTPRTNSEEYVSNKVKPPRMAIDAAYARHLEREGIWLQHENSVLYSFINREVKMTAGDPRIAELEKLITGSANT